jgi:hypothetical protein
MGIAPIFAALIHGSFAGYFTDTSIVREDRILAGIGLRQEGFGLTWQHALQDGIGWEAGTGLGLTDGLRLLLGASQTWRIETRLRPRVHAGLLFASGYSLRDIHMTVNGTDTSTFSYQTKPSISAYLAGGLQWRLFGRFGIEADGVYVQSLVGGGYTLNSTGDDGPIRKLLEATTGSGIGWAGRLFLEF